MAIIASLRLDHTHIYAYLRLRRDTSMCANILSPQPRSWVPTRGHVSQPSMCERAFTYRCGPGGATFTATRSQLPRASVAGAADEFLPRPSTSRDTTPSYFTERGVFGDGTAAAAAYTLGHTTDNSPPLPYPHPLIIIIIITCLLVRRALVVAARHSSVCVLGRDVPCRATL